MLLLSGLLSYLNERAKNKRAVPAINPTSSSIIHINTYMAEECVNMKVNPIQYWWLKKDCDRHLKSLAFKYLTPLATSVPSEEIFSSCSNLVTAKRASIKPKYVSMTIFLHKNYWIYEKFA